MNNAERVPIPRRRKSPAFPVRATPTTLKIVLVACSMRLPRKARVNASAVDPGVVCVDWPAMATKDIFV